MKKIFFILSFVIFISSCAKDKQDQRFDDVFGKVKYEVTCETVPFNVTYDNQYLNSVTEVSNLTSWEKEFDIDDGEYVMLNIDVGPPMWGNDPPAYCTLKISYKENVLISYSGVTEYETIFCLLQ